MTEATIKKTETALNEGAKKIRKEDLKTVLAKQKEIEGKFHPDGPLGGLFFDIELLISLIQDYDKGIYREIPWESLAGILTALLYVISSVDLIPDFIPLVGTIDDAVVVAVCLRLVKKDLDAYAFWKTKNP
jgi:uncharacterized membrane protein YkvA (DUF1232 family)